MNGRKCRESTRNASEVLGYLLLRPHPLRSADALGGPGVGKSTSSTSLLLFKQIFTRNQSNHLRFNWFNYIRNWELEITTSND